MDEVLEIWLSLALSGDPVGLFFAVVIFAQAVVILASVPHLILGWLR
jgi:hypothetical protein